MLIITSNSDTVSSSINCKHLAGIIITVISNPKSCLLFFWFLSSLGPKRVDYTSLVPALVVSEEAKILKSQSLEMEARFEEILALRDPNFEDLQLLQAAIDYQNQYLDQLPNYSTETTQHLEVLKKRFKEYS